MAGVLKRFIGIEVRQVGSKLRQHCSLAAFRRTCLFAHFAANPVCYPLEGSPASLFLFFRQSFRLELIVPRIFHPAQEFIARRVFKYAQGRKVSKSGKAYQVALLSRHEHSSATHERHLTRQSFPNPYPQPAVAKINVLFLNRWCIVI